MKKTRTSQRTTPNTRSKNRRKLPSSNWLFLIPVIVVAAYFIKGCVTSYGTISIPGLQSENTESNIIIKKSEGLVFYFPQYKSIDLICGIMPSPNDPNVLMCCSAAFTGKLLKEFKHSNIAGNHVSRGKFYKGYPCKSNTGCFAYFADTNTWTFAMGAYRTEVKKAAEHGGMAFGQNMIIYNDKLQTKFAIKPNSRNYYRALVEIQDELCIVESEKKIPFKDFIHRLENSGVSNAIYLDMGEGWNYAYYRDNSDHIQFLHKLKTPYSTNWIVFKK